LLICENSEMRIISLLAGGTEIVCALGAGDELVGRSHECDNPVWVRRLPCCTRAAFDTEMTSREIDAEVRRRLKAGEPLYHIDIRKINELRPELLIAQAHCEVCAVTPADVARSGEPIGCRLLSLQAGSIAGIMADVRSIADAIGRPDAGLRLVTELTARIERVRQAVAGRQRPTVALIEWTDPIFVTGNWGPELVEAAGGTPVLGAAGEHSQAIDWEALREADPDVLIIAPCGFSLPRALRELPTLEQYPGWIDLPVVQSRNAFFADGNLYFNRSGTTVADTAEIIADILHGTRLHMSDTTGIWRRHPATKSF
jgi:iron complex transport system substrate-binding protein